MAFPDYGTRDNFDGPVGLLNSWWAADSGLGLWVAALGGNASGHPNSNYRYGTNWWRGLPSNANVQLFVQVQSWGVAGLVYLSARFGSRDWWNGNGYSVEFAANGAGIFRHTGGSHAFLYTNYSHPISAGSWVGFQISGNTLTAYENSGSGWNTIVSGTDSTYPDAGHMGLRVDNYAGVKYWGGDPAPTDMLATDTVRASDSLAATVRLPLAETARAADALTSMPRLSLQDTIRVSDPTYHLHTQHLRIWNLKPRSFVWRCHDVEHP